MKQNLHVVFLSISILVATAKISCADGPLTPDVPLSMPGLIAFWDFQESAGSPRIAKGREAFSLQEQGGPIERVEGGRFGPYAARIKMGQWFLLPRPEVGALDRHGSDSSVTVVAWIRRESKSSWQAIAGLWDETRGKRQYCLFLNAPRGTNASEMKRYPLANRIHGHVSDVGGPTAGDKYCITYSSGATQIPMQKWVCVAMSYDGEYSRVYVNGRLDVLAEYNPFPLKRGLFDGGENGAPFTVGAVHRSNEWGNFFGGDIGGLAVYDRALSESELIQLAGNSSP